MNSNSKPWLKCFAFLHELQAYVIIVQELEKLIYHIEEGDDDTTIAQKAQYNKVLATNSELLAMQSDIDRRGDSQPLETAWDSWSPAYLLAYP